jgi:hypothetical protein
MAQNKKSFVVYSDWNGMFKALPDEVAGKLMKHILSYVNDENPKTEDFVINALFEQIKATLKRDLDKWQKAVEQRSLAGKRSAEVRAAKLNDRSISLNEPQRKATDNVNVNVNVNDNVIKEEVNKKKNINTKKENSEIEKPKRKTTKQKEGSYPKPTLEEIENYEYKNQYAKALMKWIDSNCPRIQRLDQPILPKQADTICSELLTSENPTNNVITGGKIKDTFLGMENKAELHKNYISALLTFRNWWKRNNPTTIITR